MKKRILSLILVFGAIVSAHAQLLPSVDFGLKAGLNFTSLRSEGQFFNNDSRAGFLAGAWARVGMLGLHVQPELYYTNKNSRVNDEDVSLSTVDLPILLGTRIGLGPIGARIQAGPLFSFVTSRDEPANTSWGSNFTALAFGVGADVSKLSLDLRYEHGLGNLNRAAGNRTSVNLWTLALGFNIL